MSWDPPRVPPSAAQPPQPPPPGWPQRSASAIPAPAPPPDRPSRWGIVAGAVAVALVVAAAAGALALRRNDGDDGGQAATTSRSTTARPAPSTTVSTGAASSTTVPPGTADPALTAVIEELSTFVERQRQREFLRPVEVELLDGQAFQDRLFNDAEEDRASTEQTEQVLQALRLIDPDVELFETLNRFLGESVLGFYDTESEALVLRGGELTPYVRVTLVHELTHALDDQHFELFRPQLDDANDESSYAFSSLVEGNASRVEEAYREGLTDAERADAAEEEAEFASNIDLSGVPSIVPTLLSFPYIIGPEFVDALVEAGGEDEVDGALHDPPVTSEHILYPERYLSDEAILPVARPTADGALIDEGVYGQWPLLVTLGEEVESAVAERAADGWGGDSYVAWATGDRACVRAAFAMDTPADLEELAAALQTWADAHGDASVNQANALVTVTACG